MFEYLSNVALDVYYGYIEIKCVNKNCNRIFKFSRNKISPNTPNHYCCNMGCALNYNNDFQKDIKDKENEEYTIV
jgi:hypothetical protein